MEALELSEAADESSGTSGAVKSEDGSPNHGTGRSSPPPNCAICLGRCRNKSFTDSCLHQFCFKCLLTWSRVKTECPLCKQNFKSIIHNVKSNHQYEEYPVQQPQSEERGPNMDFSEIVNASRFRYRTTLTLPRRETLAIRQFLMHYPLAALVSELPPRERERRAPADFRRTVYRHNLWARPLPDFTGRFRDCSPEFFRYNDSQVHRLVPWLSRELFYLLNENSAHVTYVMGRILELLPLHPILSAEFRAELHRYLGERTDHFLHEFHCFASTPYDITGYDRHVQYRTDARVSSVVNELLSSSDSDSHDSDIVMVSSSRAATPPRVPAPPRAPPPAPAVIPIETVSHSDSDSDSEVMVVGYIKPPHQRTPELVDLLASDSDVVVQEDEPAPRPAPAPAPAPAAPADSLVRFQLSVRREPEPSSAAAPAPAPRRRRTRLTPATPAAPSSESSYTPSVTPPLSPDSEDNSDDASSESSTSSSDARRKRLRRRKSRRRPARGIGNGARSPRRRREEKAKSVEASKRTKGKSRNGKDVKSSAPDLNRIPLPPSEATTTAAEERRDKSVEGSRRTKGKSRNGKNVKSSAPDVNRIPTPPSAATAIDRLELDGGEDTQVQNRTVEAVPAAGRSELSGLSTVRAPKRSSVEPGPSTESGGLEERSKRKRNVESVQPAQRALDRPGPSGLARRIERKWSTEATHGCRRDARINKRLKSVVRVMKRTPEASGAESGESRKARAGSDSSGWRRARFSSSSSDDNIPLRHSIAARRGSDYD